MSRQRLDGSWTNHTHSCVGGCGTDIECGGQPDEGHCEYELIGTVWECEACVHARETEEDSDDD